MRACGRQRPRRNRSKHRATGSMAVKVVPDHREGYALFLRSRLVLETEALSSLCEAKPMDQDLMHWEGAPAMEPEIMMRPGDTFSGAPSGLPPRTAAAAESRPPRAFSNIPGRRWWNFITKSPAPTVGEDAYKHAPRILEAPKQRQSRSAPAKPCAPSASLPARLQVLFQQDGHSRET